MLLYSVTTVVYHVPWCELVKVFADSWLADCVLDAWLSQRPSLVRQSLVQFQVQISRATQQNNSRWLIITKEIQLWMITEPVFAPVQNTDSLGNFVKFQGNQYILAVSIDI